MAPPEVYVLSLGGTISSVKTGGPGVEPSLTGEALVESVPELSEVAGISASSMLQVAGSELTIEDLIRVAGEATRAIDGGAAGVVITQGTDSIEETAFALDLLVDRDAPVVVTGAMRNPTLPGADGPANLLAAVTVAASAPSRGLGALVVMNDEIHAARYVKKAHTQSPSAFRSPLTGPLGWISEGAPRIAFEPRGRRCVAPREDATDAVALLTASVGDDGRLVGQVPELGYTGLVVEALGGGHVPSSMVEPLSTLADGMPVVLASRTYSFPGSEMDLVGRGLVPAGPLDGPKARILLTLLLRSGASRERISEAF